MELLIFCTDIKSRKKVRSISPTFNKHSDIINWSVDIEDIDNVLRIEATENLSEDDVINLVQTKGFFIQPLSD
ncbi:hypothetical protein ACFSTE_07010 [Aquimarina hainanensis]|uniref:Copper chaperone n=1 Tax=Aquimarina hainanensis TaxID=1578017 RepID=A0ABW5N5R6_9FLAO|nr:hypothetical protein [Aquimarina sp. TRL1]QKX04995.1 hypothetical protein HN014_08720 [Aquimarina sp. TRL1]